MGNKVVKNNPLISDAALLKILGVDVEDGRFKDKLKRPQIALVCELEAVQGCGTRNGEVIKEYLNFPLDEDNDLEINKESKAGRVLFSALAADEIEPDDDADDFAAKLPGRYFVAALVPSQNGAYTRIRHDTVRAPRRNPEAVEESRRKPEPEPEPEQKSPEPPEDDPETDYDDIPF